MGRVDESGDVIGHHVREIDVSRSGDECLQFTLFEDSFNDRFDTDFAVEDNTLQSLDRVAPDFQLEKKPIQLGLRKGICALQFNGILRGEYEER